jgi:uncharacterized RDD family membrane protein YckC
MNNGKYAGLWVRLGALLIDTAIAVPAVLPFMFFLLLQKTVAMIATVVLGMLIAFYFPYFHATTGQTPGKRLLNICVQSIDGSPVTWRQAIIRYAVFMVYEIAWVIAELTAIQATSYELLPSLNHRSREIHQHVPHWIQHVKLVLCVWYLLDVIALARSKEKRSLHDRMTGTVVVRVPKGPASSAE